MVIEYNLVKYRDLCFARPENLAKIHRLVGTRLVSRLRNGCPVATHEDVHLYQISLKIYRIN